MSWTTWWPSRTGAHGLDITGPLGVPFPDTDRLRHIAWLGHSSLPYAFTFAGQQRREVHCELTAPDGSTWRFGPASADSAITGPAGAFCRVGARRLRPEDSGLVARGPHGPTVLQVLRLVRPCKGDAMPVTWQAASLARRSSAVLWSSAGSMLPGAATGPAPDHSATSSSSSPGGAAGSWDC